MPGSDTDSNSSPDSGTNPLQWGSQRLYAFYTKRSKLYGKTARGKPKKISKLSDIGISATDVESLTGLDRIKIVDTALEWTTYFLNNDINLVGEFSCANKLKDGSSSNSIEVEADCLFLYYNLKPRKVHGKDKGIMFGDLRRIHLEDSKKTVDLHPSCLYALGSSNSEHPPRFRSCLLCAQTHNRHIIDASFTSCPKIYRFMSTDSSLLRMTEFAEDYGAAILHVPRNREPNLRTCAYREFLCDDCNTRAISEGNQWFRMTGDCPQEQDICPNHEVCECTEDEEENEEHIDYFFIPECSVNNLPNNPVADGLSSGRLKFVWGAQSLSDSGRFLAHIMKQTAMKRMKAGEPVMIPQLMAECRVWTLDEFLGIIMSDKRLADFIAGNKSFTLSKVNGFIENSEVQKAGPWLDGRLVKDSDNLVWHVPHMRKVVIETRGNLSCVREAQSCYEESDDLGSFIK